MNDRATETWTVQRLLEWTIGFFARKNVDPPRLSAEQLLAHVLAVQRIALYTNYQRVLSERELSKFRDLVKRAAEDEPIEYLTGKALFFNLEFEVTRDVLIPRQDTETLVENVLQLARIATGMESPRVLDLSTGSGCIAASIAFHLKSATVLATDASEAARAVAQRNIERLGLNDRVTVAPGDLFEPVARRPDCGDPFDVIVANPPYIPSAQLEALDRSVREYEPRVALDGGLDGLTLHRRILAEAPRHLAGGGRVFLEIAFDQGPSAMEIAGGLEPDFCEARIIKDNAGRDRVLAMRKR